MAKEKACCGDFAVRRSLWFVCRAQQSIFHVFPEESLGFIAARKKRKFELVAENGVRLAEAKGTRRSR
jgi:hypothetical protein